MSTEELLPGVLVTRRFTVTNTVTAQLKAHAKTEDARILSQYMRDYFGAKGVPVNPPSSLFFNGRTGDLFVRTRVNQMEKVTDIVAKLNGASHRKVKWPPLSVSTNELVRWTNFALPRSYVFGEGPVMPQYQRGWERYMSSPGSGVQPPALYPSRIDQRVGSP